MPQCMSVAEIINTVNLTESMMVFVKTVLRCIELIFLESYVSLISLILLFLSTYGFAVKGGVGCARPIAPWHTIINEGHY